MVEVEIQGSIKSSDRSSMLEKQSSSYHNSRENFIFDQFKIWATRALSDSLQQVSFTITL